LFSSQIKDRKEAVMIRHVAAFTLISWTLIYTVPPSKSGRGGLAFQRGMEGGYASEAACKSAAQHAETEWRKEGDDVTKLGSEVYPLPRCVEHKHTP
jgi:hypothetical protein